MARRVSNINGDLQYEADIVTATLLVSKASRNLAHDATSGWQPTGQLSVSADQSFSVGMETEPVPTGAIETDKDDLVRRLTGEASYMITDMNPLSGKWSMGTTAEIQWDTSGTTWSGTITSTNETSGTRQIIYVSTATGISPGDVLKIPLSSGADLFYWPGIVDDVDTTDHIIYLKHKMPEIPAAAGVIQRVRGYTLYHGGNVLQNMNLLTQLDFPKGDQHVLQVPKCSATGGFTRQLSGVVKTPMTIKMYGNQIDIGSLTNQVVCAMTHVTFPNAA